MIKALAVLATMLLGAFASIGYAAETILIQGKVTNRFPICVFSPPSTFPNPPSIGNQPQGFIFLPAQLVNGSEGVYASWYTKSNDPTKPNFVAGIWPLSAVTVSQKGPQDVTVTFVFDVASPYTPVYPPQGNVTSLEGSCKRASKGAVIPYQSDVVRGLATSEALFPAPFGPGYIDQIITNNGSRISTSAFVNGFINDQTINVIGLLQTGSGQSTILVKLVN